MSKIVIIGAGAMGTAFAFPCVDNNHDVSIIGTHLEDNFIEDLKKNDNFHSGLKLNIPRTINVFKFEKLDAILKSKIDLLVLGVSSKGIEWIADQLQRNFKNIDLPNLLVLTKGLSIYKNNYELLVDKLKRLIKQKGIKNINISAVGGPCLAAGLANRIHSSVVVANTDIKIAKKISTLLNNKYYHVSYSSDLAGVEVCAAIKNIFSMVIGASKGLCAGDINIQLKEKNYLNTASALIKQSIYEMKTFTEKLNGKEDTVYGLAGLGDLYVSSGGGRNSKMGSYLGDGMTFLEAKEKKMKNITVEGADLIFEIGKRVKKDFDSKKLPLMIAMIDAILENKKLEIKWENFSL